MFHLSLSLHGEEPVAVSEDDGDVEGSDDAHRAQDQAFVLRGRPPVLGHHHEDRVSECVEVERDRYSGTMWQVGN